MKKEMMYNFSIFAGHFIKHIDHEFYNGETTILKKENKLDVAIDYTYPMRKMNVCARLCEIAQQRSKARVRVKREI